MPPIEALLTYGLLTVAILGPWFLPRMASHHWLTHGWILPFIASLGVALRAGFVTPLALPFIAIFFVAAYIVATGRAASSLRAGSIAAVIVLSAGFMTHVVPGFANDKVISDVTFSAGALPYNQYFNYDKALIGLALIAFCVPVCREKSRWGTMFKATLPWSLLVFVVVVSLAVLIGYVRFDPKLPPEFFLWAWINLFFTCIPEEALFRGFVQQGRRTVYATPGMGS